MVNPWRSEESICISCSYNLEKEISPRNVSSIIIIYVVTQKMNNLPTGEKKKKSCLKWNIEASCPIALLLCVFLFFIFYFSFFIVYLFRKRLQGDELSFKHPCKLQASRNWMTHVNEMLMWIQWNCIGKWGYNVIAFLIYGDF